MISLLFAMDRNRAIGYNNDLPWRLPNDLKFFKQLTTTNTIIMGRKTFDSLGKALPNRTNVVVTRDETFHAEDCQVIHSIEPILEWNKINPEKEFFVIGGANLFEQILPYAERMYMTWIDQTFPSDTYFPSFNELEWKLIKKEKGIKNEKNPFDYYFIQYDRK